MMATVLVRGVTWIAVNVALVTVSVVVPETPATAAEIVVLPGASVLAWWVVTSSVATSLALDCQAAPLDTSETVPSENVPVAVNDSLTPTPALGLVGASAIETNLALLMVNAAEPLTLPTLARIVVVPVAMPLATPLLATVATAGLAEVHAAVAVTSCVVASLRVTTA